MKKIILIVHILFLFSIPVFSQSIILRDDFSESFGYTFSNYSISIDTILSTEPNGENALWNYSNLPLYSTGITGRIVNPATSPFSQTNHSFLLEYQDSSDASLIYEFYNFQGSVLQLSGYGILNADGSTGEEMYEKPFTILRFPWELGAGFEDDNSLRLSIRRYTGFGTLRLPFGIVNNARKFVEEFTQDGVITQEHSWYHDSIPYPILVITSAYTDDTIKPDKQVIQLNLPKKDITGIQSTISDTEPFTHCSVYNVLGELIQQFDKNEYVNITPLAFKSLAPGYYFVVLQNSQGKFSSFPLIQNQ